MNAMPSCSDWRVQYSDEHLFEFPASKEDTSRRLTVLLGHELKGLAGDLADHLNWPKVKVGIVMAVCLCTYDFTVKTHIKFTDVDIERIEDAVVQCAVTEKDNLKRKREDTSEKEGKEDRGDKGGTAEDDEAADDFKLSALKALWERSIVASLFKFQELAAPPYCQKTAKKLLESTDFIEYLCGRPIKMMCKDIVPVFGDAPVLGVAGYDLENSPGAAESVLREISSSFSKGY